MIEIRGAHTLDGKRITVQVPGVENLVIEAEGLTLFPALIDAHVHFRTPGLEHKEDWRSAARAAIKGGITTVFDMPNTLPAAITQQRLEEKRRLIDEQLQEIGIPLRYGLYLGADKDHFEEMAKAKQQIVGLKIFMGSSTGDLVMDDEESLQTAFRMAAEHDLLVAVHAEDEALIHTRKALFQGMHHPRVHSLIRNYEVAVRATAKAIELARKYGTRLFLLHIGTKEELELIRKAKREGVSVFAETTPHHLFLNQGAYETWGTKVQANPPLRTEEDNAALWEAIQDGTIDTIGSDHAPHTLEEKNRPYGSAPSGIPGVETTLPLLLDAAHRGYLSLPQIIRLMKTRVEEIFRLPPNDDLVLVDLQKVDLVRDADLQTKCGWSPYAGQSLKGWPVCTILKGKIYDYAGLVSR
jgi:dihydroorotase